MNGYRTKMTLKDCTKIKRNDSSTVRAAPSQGSYARYDALKRSWADTHPEATAREYEAACQLLARMAGI